MAKLAGWGSGQESRVGRRLILGLAFAFVLTVHAVVPKPAQEARSAPEDKTCRYKFLVLDDTHILKTQQLKRKVNAAVKHPQPVLRLDVPWHNKNEMLNYINVLYDEEERLFKMWYCTMSWDGRQTDGPRRFAYATSTDGFRWERPALGLFEVNGSKANSFVTPEMDQAFVCTIMKDPSDIAARRYKMVFSTGGPDPDWARFHIPLSIAYSHDGIRWERPRHVNPVVRGVSDTPWGFLYDPDRRTYSLFTRRVPNTPRDVSLYESYDLVNWEDKGRVLVPGDEHDPRDVRTNAYYMMPFRYGDLYLGAINCLYAHPVSEAYGSYHKSPNYPADRLGQEDVQLAYSRDGRTWKRPDDRSSIVPIGKPGDLDSGTIYAAHTPIVRNGETWIYYTASRKSHNWWDWLGTYDPAKGMRDEACAMLARMPEDHWISLDAGEDEGWFQTMPWGPPQEILVNADAEGGTLSVELVTPDGHPIEGFTRAESIPITSNGKDRKVAWKSGRSVFDLREAHRGGICARFYLRRAKLYSYTMVLPDPDGALTREKANARWLEIIKHRSDNWDRRSNEPASGPPPQKIP